MQHLAKNCRRTEGKFTERGKCRSEKGGGSEDTSSHACFTVGPCLVFMICYADYGLHVQLPRECCLFYVHLLIQEKRGKYIVGEKLSGVDVSEKIFSNPCTWLFGQF